MENWKWPVPNDGFCDISDSSWKKKTNSRLAIHFLVIKIRSSYFSQKLLRFLFLLCKNLTNFRFICDIGYCLRALSWYTTDCSLINIANGCTYGSDLCLKWISTFVFLIANTDLLIFFSWIHKKFQFVLLWDMICRCSQWLLTRIPSRDDCLFFRKKKHEIKSLIRWVLLFVFFGFVCVFFSIYLLPLFWLLFLLLTMLLQRLPKDYRSHSFTYMLWKRAIRCSFRCACG